MSDTGSGSRILRLRRTVLRLFWEQNLKTVCFDPFSLNHGQHHIPAASGLVHRHIVMGYGAALKAYTGIRLHVDRQKIPYPSPLKNL
jgi:hypothetical protein